MEVFNHIWKSLFTVLLCYFLFVLFNQNITTDQIVLSLMLAGLSTLFLRFFIAKGLPELIDFKWIREVAAIALAFIIIMIWKG